MKTGTKVLLGVIFLVILGLRLYVAFQSPQLEYSSYSTLRNVENIRETGVPLFIDDLSFSGRNQLFSPIFYYVLAGFTFLMPIVTVAKIIPNIFASLLVFVIFYISLYLIKKENIALIIAAVSGLIPVFFTNTINNVSVFTLVIPLFFLTAYYFLLSNKDSKQLPKLLISMIVLTILHPSSIILIFSLLIYVLLIKIQHFRKTSREIELVLFFLFFVFWVNMVVYKNAFLTHGASVIWQNIPGAILSTYFIDLTFIESILAIGLVPIILGLAGVYLNLFTVKRKISTLMMSIGVAIFILLLFKLISLIIGLIFLGVVLSVLSAFSLDKFYEQSQMAKLRRASTYLLMLVMLVVVVSFVPNVYYAISHTNNIPSYEDINAFVWLKENTSNQSIILVLPEEGAAMSYFAHRKNVIDDNYLLIRNINLRYEDVSSVYTDLFLTTALEKLNYYSVDYIVLTEYTQNKYNISKLAYEDINCLRKVYPTEGLDGPKIYEVVCVLNTQK